MLASRPSQSQSCSFSLLKGRRARLKAEKERKGFVSNWSAGHEGHRFIPQAEGVAPPSPR